MMHYYGSTAASHKRIVIVIVNDESWEMERLLLALSDINRA
jgi:hypothetical protein